MSGGSATEAAAAVWISTLRELLESLNDVAVFIAPPSFWVPVVAMNTHDGSSHKSARNGRFVTRGTKLGKYVSMGTAKDGTVIIEPKLSPKSATKAQIRKAVRTVKERHRRDKTMATAGGSVT